MFKVGDKVKIVDEVGTAIIKQIVDDMFVIVEENGFDRKRNRSELINIKDYEVLKQDPMLSGPDSFVSPKDVLEANGRKKKAKAVKKLHDPNIQTIDLHYDKLPSEYRKNNAYSELQQQLRYFERSLNLARKSRKQQLHIIHGIGQGVLKAEVIYRLKQYELVFRDESISNLGTTVVYLG